MMRVLYVKCSERKKEDSIVTKIVENDGHKTVIKRAIFEEGKKHISKLVNNRNILVKLYGGNDRTNRIIDYHYGDKQAVFEFMEGTPLSYWYIDAIKKHDKKRIMSVIDEHQKLIIGNDGNKCVFHESDESRKYFGDLSRFEGKMGLCITNFEATAKNIFITGEEYTFIDYEWVFDFPLPLDIVLYQVFISAGFNTFNGLEEMISKKKLLEYLGVDESIKDNWEHFINNHYSQSGEYIAYSNYLKKIFDYRNLQQKQTEYEAQAKYIEDLKLEWCQKNADVEIEKNNALRLEKIIANKSEEIADLSSKNLELEEIRNMLEVDNSDLNKTLQEYKKYIDILEKKIRYLE